MNSCSHAIFVCDHSHQPERPLPGASRAFSICPADIGPRSRTMSSTWSANSPVPTHPGVRVAESPPAQQRLQLHRHQRCDMRPGLQQQPVARPVGPRGAVEDGGRVGAEPGEHRQVVGTGQHVHRVDLQQPDGVHQPTQVSPVGRRSGRPGRIGQPLRGDRYAPRGGGRDLGGRSRHPPILARPTDIGPHDLTGVRAAEGPSTTIGRAPHLVGTASGTRRSRSWGGGGCGVARSAGRPA